MSFSEDYLSSEVALSPLLHHASYRPPKPASDKEKDIGVDENDEDTNTVMVETYLGTTRKKISVILTSYQSARHLLNSRGRRSVHGFILVYDTQRTGTFSVMKVFANWILSYLLTHDCLE